MYFINCIIYALGKLNKNADEICQMASSNQKWTCSQIMPFNCVAIAFVLYKDGTPACTKIDTLVQHTDGSRTSLKVTAFDSIDCSNIGKGDHILLAGKCIFESPLLSVINVVLLTYTHTCMLINLYRSLRLQLPNCIWLTMILWVVPSLYLSLHRQWGHVKVKMRFRSFLQLSVSGPVVLWKCQFKYGSQMGPASKIWLHEFSHQPIYQDLELWTSKIMSICWSHQAYSCETPTDFQLQCSLKLVNLALFLACRLAQVLWCLLLRNELSHGMCHQNQTSTLKKRR